MVTKAPAGTDWLGRLFVPVLLLMMGTAQTGVVIYFSSQAAAIAQLRADMVSETREIRNLEYANKQDIAVTRAMIDATRPERRR